MRLHRGLEAKVESGHTRSGFVQNVEPIPIRSDDTFRATGGGGVKQGGLTCFIN